MAAPTSKWNGVAGSGAMENDDGSEIGIRVFSVATAVEDGAVNETHWRLLTPKDLSDETETNSELRSTASMVSAAVEMQSRMFFIMLCVFRGY